MTPDLGIIPRSCVGQPENDSLALQQGQDTMGAPPTAELASGALSFSHAHCVDAAGDGQARPSGPAEGAAPPVVPSLDTSVTFVEVERIPAGEKPPCATWRNLKCGSCGHRFRVAVGCGDRLFCPYCRAVRIHRVTKIVRPVFEWLYADGAPLSFTLTVRSDPNMAGQRDLVLKSFRKLRQRVLWKRAVLGGIAFNEFTHGKLGWHTHIHGWARGSYIDQAALAQAWSEVTGGEGIVVWISRTKWPLEKTLKEAVKYVCKDVEEGADGSKKPLSEIFKNEARSVLHSKDLFITFGAARGLERNVEPKPMKCPKCGVEGCIQLDRDYDLNDVCSQPNYLHRPGSVAPAIELGPGDRMILDWMIERDAHPAEFASFYRMVEEFKHNGEAAQNQESRALKTQADSADLQTQSPRSAAEGGCERPCCPPAPPERSQADRRAETPPDGPPDSQAVPRDPAVCLPLAKARPARYQGQVSDSVRSKAG